MDKIYTKKGDGGDTGLRGSERVSKASARIDALGTIDEANAAIGLLLMSLPEKEITRKLLIQTQSRFFSCGSRIADAEQIKAKVKGVPTATTIKIYEKSIDELTRQMPPLTNFILPGGTEASTRAHVARAIVRRAERSLVALRNTGAKIDPTILKFFNRLSDWFFTLARWYNFQAGIADSIWQPKK